jgi:hypothetical protein
MGMLKSMGKALMKKMNIKRKKKAKKATKPGAVDDNAIKRRDDRRKNQDLMIKRINF